jgi:caa(3)-type oxidase subunit IV
LKTGLLSSNLQSEICNLKLLGGIMAEKVVTPKTYLIVYAILLACTALTVGLSRLPLSEDWHTAFGLSIAAVKASLVILVFMHLIYSTRLTWVVALSGLLWLGILIGYTLTDYLTRTWNPTVGR